MYPNIFLTKLDQVQATSPSVPLTLFAWNQLWNFCGPRTNSLATPAFQGNILRQTISQSSWDVFSQWSFRGLMAKCCRSEPTCNLGLQIMFCHHFQKRTSDSTWSLQLGPQTMHSKPAVRSFCRPASARAKLTDLVCSQRNECLFQCPDVLRLCPSRHLPQQWFPAHISQAPNGLRLAPVMCFVAETLATALSFEFTAPWISDEFGDYINTGRIDKHLPVL